MKIVYFVVTTCMAILMFIGPRFFTVLLWLLIDVVIRGTTSFRETILGLEERLGCLSMPSKG
jgi:hypothetical protein